MKKRILLASPRMLGNEQKYVKEVFKSNWIAPLGPFVMRFENNIKEYLNMEGVCATSSGTAALHLAIKLAGIKRGDYVFCSSLTFSASANPITYEGGIPVFIDSESDTYNMSPLALEKAFKKYHPKAVIVVSLYGNPAKLDEIKSICDKYHVIMIEDAAESLGALYKGKKVGSFGKYSILSFNGNKIITTSGGGILLTDNESDAEKALFWATQSREKARHYEHREIGYNYRMSNICAAVGCGQLEIIDKQIDKKRDIFNNYKESFKDIKEIEMKEDINSFSTHWLSILKIDAKAKVKPLDIIMALDNSNIESRPIWKPMHLQPVFKACDFFNHNDSGMSVCEELFNNGLCLPSDVNMTLKEQEKVIKIIKKLFS